jgi:hypothetical protein
VETVESDSKRLVEEFSKDIIRPPWQLTKGYLKQQLKEKEQELYARTMTSVDVAKSHNQIISEDMKLPSAPCKYDITGGRRRRIFPSPSFNQVIQLIAIVFIFANSLVVTRSNTGRSSLKTSDQLLEAVVVTHIPAIHRQKRFFTFLLEALVTLQLWHWHRDVHLLFHLACKVRQAESSALIGHCIRVANQNALQ